MAHSYVLAPRVLLVHLDNANFHRNCCTRQFAGFQLPLVSKSTLLLSLPTSEPSASMCGTRQDRRSSVVCAMDTTFRDNVVLSCSTSLPVSRIRTCQIGIATLSVFARTSPLSSVVTRLTSRYVAIDVLKQYFSQSKLIGCVCRNEKSRLVP